MANKQENLETVNSAGRAMSDNVDFISPREGYFIFENKYGVKQELEDAQKIVDESPEYMTSTELDFLAEFISEFKSAERPGGYNLENQTYLKLFRALLEALDDRMDRERLDMAEEGDEVAIRIQHIFYLIDSTINNEFEEIEENWEELVKGKRSLLQSADRVNWMIKQLVRAYKFEFDYKRGNDINLEAVNTTESRLRNKWRNAVERDPSVIHS